EVVQEVRHGLPTEDDGVLAGRNPLAADRGERVRSRLDTGLVGEAVEAGPGGPTRALGALGLDHRGDERRDQRGLVRLDARHVGGRDRHALLEDGDVAPEDHDEAPEARGRSRARRAPVTPRSLGSLPKPTSGPADPTKAARMPRPHDAVDFGSSTPLEGMWEV